MGYKKTAIATALTASLGLGSMATAEAAFISAVWEGLFTFLTPTGAAHQNTSYPYYGDTTWNYGLRTQISGTFSFSTSTNSISVTVNPFNFWDFGASLHDITLQSIGDGFGGNGALMVGSMLFDWATTQNMSIGIVLDATGFLSAGIYGTSQTISSVGALPASNAVAKNTIPIGPAPMATTAWDTNFNINPSCAAIDSCLVVSGDTIGGDPMDNSTFAGYSANMDITSIHFDSVVYIPPPPVPVSAAAWLFGSGLIGLANVARRRKQR